MNDEHMPPIRGVDEAKKRLIAVRADVSMPTVRDELARPGRGRNAPRERGREVLREMGKWPSR